MRPRASVVIPTYNREAFLSQAVATALATGLQELEVVIVDDGSTDGSLAVAERLAHADARIQLITHRDRRNHGPGATLNLGVRHSRAPLVCFLGSDDLLLPGRFDRSLPLLEADQSIDGVYEVTATEIMASGESRRGTVRELVTFDCQSPEEVLATLVRHGRHWSADAILLRKELFQRVGGFPENRELQGVEDLALWLKLAAVARLVPGRAEPVAVYRLHGENLSSVPNDRHLILPLLAHIDVCKWARTFPVPHDASRMLTNATSEKAFFVCGQLRAAGHPAVGLTYLLRAAAAIPQISRHRRFWGNVVHGLVEAASLRSAPQRLQ